MSTPKRIDIERLMREADEDTAAWQRRWKAERSAREGRYDFSDWNEPRRAPTVVRVPLWLIVVAVLAVAVMAAHVQ